MLAKKSLGQHFLRSKSALEKIAEAGHLSSDDTVLEVGPGEGALTELLLQRAGKVIAVEKDDRLIPVLAGKFQHEIAVGRLELIHGDILEFSIFPPAPKRLRRAGNFQFSKKPYKIVANLPYYITGKFLRKFLESEAQPSTMVLLLQKEVARRIASLPRRTRRRQVAKESILSISVKVYGTPTYIDTVKAGAFSPPPKVDSAIIAIERISKEFFADIDERAFFELLKKGFAHPRKLLSSNLGIPPAMLERCGILGNARSENLSVADWQRLSLYLQGS